MAFNANLFIRYMLEHVADLFQHLNPRRFDFRFSRIEEDAIDHINGELIPHLFDGDVALFDVVFQRLGEIFMGFRQLLNLGFLRSPFLFKPLLFRRFLY